ncbi:MAG: hypothetical protein HY741_14115 [Chloroflexi bacterium]|nr:hypothetical protein [Chloroflexota bacterium]
MNTNGLHSSNLSDNLMPQEDYGIESPNIAWGADDVIILSIGALLSLYTMWRSADFLSQTIPDGLQFRELVIALGIVGMDISMWAWAFTWLHWARTKSQKNLALGMFILTSFIVSIAAITDAAIYFFGGALQESVRVMAFFIVIGGAILVAIAAFAYHNISPKVQVERGLRIAKSEIEKKRAQHFADFETKRLEHQADMEKRRLTVTHQLETERQDLELSEQLVKTRNAMVERAKQVARLKTDQDRAFEELHNVMRFVTGGAANDNGNGNGNTMHADAPTLSQVETKAARQRKSAATGADDPNA